MEYPAVQPRGCIGMWQVFTVARGGLVEYRTSENVMVHSYCTGTELGTGSMVSNIICRNVHTSPRQRQGLGTHCFLLCLFRSLYRPWSRSRAVWISHYIGILPVVLEWQVYVVRDTGRSGPHPPGGFHYEQQTSTSFDAYGLKHGEIKKLQEINKK